MRILDSTVPAQIKAIEAELDLGKTLFIVSSKSGSTTEPNALKDYFFKRVADTVGANKAGQHFIAITDPGSPLEQRAREQNFRHIFHGVPSIGGRYSVLSPFGLVPAAIAGIDVAQLVRLTRVMMRSCGPDVPPSQNPAIALGIALGAAALRGRDKVTILATPALSSFGAWVEQLFAESTGKLGKGLIPIDGEPLGRPEVYGDDRFFIDLALEGETDAEHEAKLKALEKAGHPVVRIVQHSLDHIGQEFFRFEIATAIAGAVLEINPFDQPDVEASKSQNARIDRRVREDRASCRARRRSVPTNRSRSIPTKRMPKRCARPAPMAASTAGSEAHFARIGSGDYVALLAYLARDDEHCRALAAAAARVARPPPCRDLP